MMTDTGRVTGSREPSPSSTGLGPSGFDPARSIFDRWRLYADHLYRTPETRREFEREYGNWYSAKFGIVPEMTEVLRAAFMPVWASYRLAREDVTAESAMDRRRLEAMLLNLKSRISNLPRRNVGGFLDTQIREVLADIDCIDRRVAIAMEARQGRDGETRLDPKDDSAGPSGHRPTRQTKDGPNHD